MLSYCKKTGWLLYNAKKITSLHQSSSAHQISAINVTKIMNCYDFALTDNKLIKIKQLIKNKSLN